MSCLFSYTGRKRGPEGRMAMIAEGWEGDERESTECGRAAGGRVGFNLCMHRELPHYPQGHLKFMHVNKK